MKNTRMKCYGSKFQGNGFSSFSFKGTGFFFQFQGEWVFSFRGMGFGLDAGEEHEDEDNTG